MISQQWWQFLTFSDISMFGPVMGYAFNLYPQKRKNGIMTLLKSWEDQ